MDAVVGTFIWPFVTLFQYLRFTCGCLIAAFPCLLVVLKGERRKFSNYLDIWNILSRLPLGRYVFSGIAAFIAPYTASVAPCVQNLTTNSCEATIDDLPWLRNPFGSIHAVAITNLGEFVTGLSVLTLLQQEKYGHLRGIPVSIETEFIKKARGQIRGKGMAFIEVADVLFLFLYAQYSIIIWTT
jgi:hypothetical protein